MSPAAHGAVGAVLLLTAACLTARAAASSPATGAELTLLPGRPALQFKMMYNTGTSHTTAESANYQTTAVISVPMKAPAAGGAGNCSIIQVL